MKMVLMKEKNFSLFILGKLVSLVGSNMQQFALSLYVLAITGSATIFASILSIIIIPRLILSPIAGVFGDWFDRKKSIVILDMLNAIILAVYSLIFIYKGGLTVAQIYILVILLEITEIFFHSSVAAVLPSIVEKEDLLEANAMNSLVMNIGNLLSPPLAAIIYGAFGMKVILIINTISFFLSSISEIFIDIPKYHKSPDKISLKAFKEDLVAGIKVLRSNKLVGTIITSGGVLNFCVSPLASIGLIFIMKEILLVSDMKFGIFQMILASSFIVAPIIGGKRIREIKLNKLLYYSFIAIAIVVLLMMFIPFNYFKSNLIPYVALTATSFLIGLFATLANISLGAFFNEIVPLELMGRVSTIMGLVMTILIPIGQMIFGYLYDIMLPNIVIGISGTILLLVTLKYRSDFINYQDDSNQDTIGEV